MGISLNPASLLSGQGLDVTSLVNELLNQKAGPLQEWQNEQSTLQTQAGLLASINNDLANLATAVSALSDPLGALAGQTAASSDTSVLTATADTSAPAGVHLIVVSKLASAGMIYTEALPNGTTSILKSGVTSGNIQLQVGGSIVHDIAITSGNNDTLNTLASYINGQNWGITANVVADSSGARLALYSGATGTAGALVVTGNDTNLTFNAPTGGSNASVTIDGIPYSSPGNTISGAIAGVTLNLTGAAPDEPVQVTVAADTTRATQAINNFVSAYNQVVNDINQQFSINPTTNNEGPLGSDSALRQLQTSLLADVTYSISGNGGYNNLASLGVNMNNDGTLTVDSSQLNNVLSRNPSAFLNFFQDSTQTGFADLFHKDLTNLTDSTQGLLSVDLTQNKAQQQILADNISNFQDQLAAQQKQLTDEFSKVNASLQAYPLLLQQVTETLAALDSTGAGNGSSAPVKTSGL